MKLFALTVLTKEIILIRSLVRYEKGIIKIINSLKNKTSAGYDEITINLIKNDKFQLVKPITSLVNSSFVTGMFPIKSLKLPK